MNSGMRVDANGKLYFRKPTRYDALPNKIKQMWDQAESMLYCLLVILNNNGIKAQQDGVLSEEAQLYLVSIVSSLFEKYKKYI